MGHSWELTLTSDEESWCAFKVIPNGGTLGKRLGRKLRQITEEVKLLTSADLISFLRTGTIVVCGEELQREDLFVNREFVGDKTRYEADVSSDGSLVVIVDTLQDEATVAQGVARELINRVQKLRKKAGLQVNDSIEVYFDEKNGDSVLKALQLNRDLVFTTLKVLRCMWSIRIQCVIMPPPQMLPLPFAQQPAHAVYVADDKTTIGSSEVHLYLTPPTLAFDCTALLNLTNGNEATAKLLAQYVYTLEYSNVVNSAGNVRSI